MRTGLEVGLGAAHAARDNSVVRVRIRVFIVANDTWFCVIGQQPLPSVYIRWGADSRLDYRGRCLLAHHQRQVHRRVAVQPRDAIAWDAADGLEIASDEDFAVRLQRCRVHCERRAAGIKAGVNRAVRVQPRNAGSPRAAHRSELADGDLAIGLECDCVHSLIHVGIERCVERAIRVQPGDVVARSAVGHCECAADENLVV